MHDEAAFATWLKRERRRQDLTQDALRERARCSGGYIRKLESGARRPARELAQELAEILNLPGERRSQFVGLARRRER